MTIIKYVHQSNKQGKKPHSKIKLVFKYESKGIIKAHIDDVQKVTQDSDRPKQVKQTHRSQ